MFSNCTVCYCFCDITILFEHSWNWANINIYSVAWYNPVFLLKTFLRYPLRLNESQRALSSIIFSVKRDSLYLNFEYWRIVKAIIAKNVLLSRCIKLFRIYASIRAYEAMRELWSGVCLLTLQCACSEEYWNCST